MAYDVSSFHGEQRTAGFTATRNNPHKSIQAWKKPATQPPHPTSSVTGATGATDIPAGTATKSAKNDVLQTLQQAHISPDTLNSLLDHTTTTAYAPTNLDLAPADINYSDTDSSAGTKSGNIKNSGTGYSFYDVIDAVNPLHHLPVVGYVYRGLTGDTLHPASQIIGGGIYGGGVGALFGTVNAISQMKTGKDLGGYALSLAGMGGDTANPPHPSVRLSDDPQTRLNNAARQGVQGYTPNNLDNLPVGALSFARANQPVTPITAQRTNPTTHGATHPIAQGRTAGKVTAAMATIMNQQEQPTRSGALNATTYKPLPPEYTLPASMPPRETITKVDLAPMPPRESSLNIGV